MLPESNKWADVSNVLSAGSEPMQPESTAQRGAAAPNLSQVEMPERKAED